MNAKYTPGPWRTEDHAPGFGVCVVDAQNVNTVYAYELHKTPEECESNARLIAAAPELLEALNDCDHAFAAWQMGVVPGRPKDILALIAKVRAAIAKAEGLR